MKLQKQLSRKFAGKEYPKWIIVIPPKKIKELNWKGGEELEAKIIRESLVLIPKKLKLK
jgi:hypothetical protein